MEGHVSMAVGVESGDREAGRDCIQVRSFGSLFTIPSLQSVVPSNFATVLDTKSNHTKI